MSTAAITPIVHAIHRRIRTSPLLRRRTSTALLAGSTAVPASCHELAFRVSPANPTGGARRLLVRFRGPRSDQCFDRGNRVSWLGATTNRDPDEVCGKRRSRAKYTMCDIACQVEHQLRVDRLEPKRTADRVGPIIQRAHARPRFAADAHEAHTR
jgi:hypothetical protein